MDFITHIKAYDEENGCSFENARTEKAVKDIGTILDGLTVAEAATVLRLAQGYLWNAKIHHHE